MTTAAADRPDGSRIAVCDEGAGPPVLLAHPLGLDLTVWDGVAAALPGHRVVRWDSRGHGASVAAPGPIRMGALVADAEAVAESRGIRDAVVVGIGLGGLVAQGLAVKRPDLVAALVLSGSAARLPSPAHWAARAAQVRTQGLAAEGERLSRRWFSRDARARGLDLHWRARLLACPPAIWAATAEAIAGADFYTTTAALHLPVLGLAGAEDAEVPPDLVAETAALAQHGRFHLIRRQGHLPCVEDPAGMARLIAEFAAGAGGADLSRLGRL